MTTKQTASGSGIDVDANASRVGALLACIADDKQRAMYQAAPALIDAIRQCAEGLERDYRLSADPSHPLSRQTVANRAAALRAALARAGL